MKSANLQDRIIYKRPEGCDEFFTAFAEWLFNPIRYPDGRKATINIPKLMYDYIFLSFYEVDEYERFRNRADWTPELEPFYGEPFLYRTPFGDIELRKQM